MYVFFICFVCIFLLYGELIWISAIYKNRHYYLLSMNGALLFQVMNGALLQQVFIVEFVVHNQMCDNCHRVEAKDFWRACVQIRQKVGLGLANLKLTLRQYPAIYTNYMFYHCTTLQCLR